MCDCNDCGCQVPSWTPNNTKSVYNINDTDPTNLYIEQIATPPDDWFYIGYSGETLYRTSAGSSITICCDCDGPGSCRPWSEGSKNGCDTGTCSGGCTKSVSIIPNTGDTAVAMTTGGFISLSFGVNFATTTDLPSAFPAMFELTEVQTLMSSFFDKIYGSDGTVPDFIVIDNVGTVPYGYYVAVLNICGRAVSVPIPVTTVVPPGSFIGTAASCSKCSDGSGSSSCLLHTSDGRSTCYGDCTSNCCLTTRGTNGVDYKAYSYLF